MFIYAAFFFLIIRRPPRSTRTDTLFPYTTLFRSLFYGSCLREKNLDGLMLDFYLIVSDYRAAYGKRWLATANRLIPPNVFPFEHHGLVAKYAVLSAADFARLNSPAAANVSVLARFAQPARPLWAAAALARHPPHPPL